MTTQSMFLAACLTLTTVSSALAASPPDASGDSGNASTTNTKGDFEHDGFYLRASAGFGAYNESFRAPSTSRYGKDAGGDASGSSSVGELAVGYAVRPGLVLGGGIYAASLLSSSFEPVDGVTVPDQVTPKRRNFALVGPLLDWYPNAKKGFHLQGAVGFATLNEGWGRRDVSADEKYLAVGGGAMVGVGYDWFVAEQWSLGVMARVTGAVVTGEDDNGVRFYHAVGTSPALLLSGTYN